MEVARRVFGTRRQTAVPGPLASLFLAAMLALSGLFVLLPGTAQAQTAEPPSFPDVAASNPAHDAIVYLAGAKVISGFANGTFGPDQVLTRGQATKILVIWQGVPLATASTGSSHFTDVDSTYQPYVNAAAAQGWIGGYPDGTFRPYNQLTREQMGVILIRSMGLEGAANALSTSQINQALAPFADSSAISASARPFLALAVMRGLFSGDGTRLSPASGITRAQFCLVVFRAELAGLAVPQSIGFDKSYTDKTRVVVNLSQALGAVTAAITAGGVLTVDCAGAGIGGTLAQSVGSTEVKSVTATELTYRPQVVRLTFNLARYESFRVMSLAPSGNYGYRIVVDVFRRTDGPPGDGPPLVCVDPGHGGVDPGAIGVNGVKEKDLNLAIGLALAQDLHNAGLAVMMTRDDDTYPTLQQRTDMANAAHASLFVSVHNNAGDVSASGTETYYWQDSNDPSIYSVAGQKLATLIQQDLVAALGSIDRGAKTPANGLWVLDNTNMTAVLTEVGFLTNPAEEAKLVTPAYQQLAAGAIAKGILDYLGWSTTVYTTE